MVQPNFLIIGGQRCGTTSLWTALREHPGIHVANEKELNYFNDTKTPYKTEEWYEDNFIPENDVQFTDEYDPETTPVGEASVNYLFFSEVAELMHNYNPEFKLIISLRDPVRRAISQYHWEVRMTNEKLSLGQALAAEEERLQFPQNRAKFGYKARGRYAEQLDNIFSFFFREQVLLLPFEDLVRRPAEFVQRATDFIGASRWDGYTFTHVLKNDYEAPDPVDVVGLTKYFKNHNERLADMYGVSVESWL